MSEESTETTNPEPISAPVATPEPIPEASIPSSTSEPVTMPPEAPEGSREAKSAVPVNNDIEQNSPTEAEIPVPEQTAQIPPIEPFARLGLLAQAREMIQFRKRRKLEKIMSMFLKQSNVTNDEVEKLLHISDATATRYLEQLEKEGKIMQSGRTGTGVSYSKII